MRGVAVLLVVAFHAGLPGFQGGFIGVDVFFVLSGYLITGLLVKELSATGRLNIVQFYARRARRLLPASALMLITIICVARFLLPPLEQERLSRTAIATAAYLSNVFFLRRSNDYFAPDLRTNPFLHTWSLAVEEQFYLVWPVLLVLAMRFFGSRRKLAIFIAASSAVSLAASVWLIRTNQSWAFFGSPARAWEFGVGALVSLASASSLCTQRRWMHVMGWAGMVSVLAAAILCSATSFPGVGAIPPVIGTAAVIAAGVAAPNIGVSGLLARNVLQRVGRLSYSWYLWHWPVLAIAPTLAGPLSFGGRMLCVSSSLVLAAFTHRLVENPIRFNRQLLPRPVLSLCLAGAVTIAAIGLTTAWRWSASHAPQYREFAYAANDMPRLYETGCLSEGGLRECAFGDPASGTTVVLFGDSHAAEWFPALERIAKQQGYRIVTLLKAACPAAGVVPGAGHGEYECAAWRDAAIRRIITLRPAAVVMGSFSGYVKRHGDVHITRPGILYARYSYHEWEEATRKTLATLDGAGVITLLIRDSPMAGFDVPVCLARTAWYGYGGCALPRSDVLDDAVFGAERNAAKGMQHVFTVDLSDQICGAATCEPARNGLISYSDGNHLTASFVETLTPAFAARIVPVITAAGISRPTDAAAVAGQRVGSGLVRNHF